MNFQEPESEAGRGDQDAPLTGAEDAPGTTLRPATLRKGSLPGHGGHSPGVAKKILSTKNAANSSGGGGDLNGCFPGIPFAELHVRENFSH